MKSEFFDDKENVIGDHDDTQINMFEYPDEKKILKKLHKEIQMLIEKKISVYLSDKAEEAVEAMITERKTFPEFPDDVYGQMRKNDLKWEDIYKVWMNIPLRRSRLSGKMETTCPDRRKPL